MGNPRMNRAVLATIAAAFVFFGAFIATTDPIDTVGYPVASVSYLEDQGLLSSPHRVAHQEVVGNYMTLRFGTDVRVFIDDRFDMYPLSLSRDYRVLLSGNAGTMDIIERRNIDVVLWKRDLPLVQILTASGWREVFGEKDYVVLQR
jgi:hypothetical protein